MRYIWDERRIELSRIVGAPKAIFNCYQLGMTRTQGSYSQDVIHKFYASYAGTIALIISRGSRGTL